MENWFTAYLRFWVEVLWFRQYGQGGWLNIRDDIGGEIHSLEENYKDQVVWTEDPKEQLDSFEKKVVEEDIRDDIIGSLDDQELIDSVNQFPKMKEDNRELSKTETITFGSFEVEIDSIFYHKQLSEGTSCSCQN